MAAVHAQAHDGLLDRFDRFADDGSTAARGYARSAVRLYVARLFL